MGPGQTLEHLYRHLRDVHHIVPVNATPDADGLAEDLRRSPRLPRHRHSTVPITRDRAPSPPDFAPAPALDMEIEGAREPASRRRSPSRRPMVELPARDRQFATNLGLPDPAELIEALCHTSSSVPQVRLVGDFLEIQCLPRALAPKLEAAGIVGDARMLSLGRMSVLEWTSLKRALENQGMTQVEQMLVSSGLRNLASYVEGR